MPVSQFTPSPSPAVSTCLLSVSVSHCCPAHRFISTIFLDSIYMHSVQSLSHVRLFVTPWTAARQASLPITNSKNLFKLMSIESVMPSNISSSVSPFSSCLQSLPASGSFQMSQLFASGGQSIGFSASVSVLPMYIQDLFSLGLTGWISLQSKGLS